MLFIRTTVRTTCLTLALIAPTLASADPLADGRRDHLGSHVRGASPAVNTLIQKGVSRSRTFKELVDRLNDSDVVVYVNITHDLPVGLEGRLSFMTYAGSVRYLHAQVHAGLGEEGTLAVVAHELQHAVEVADHPEVRSANALAVLYQRIGERSSVALNRYDTAAARSKGRKVRQELS